MNFTRRLALFANQGISFDSLPCQVVALSKEMMIDAAAVGLAGAAQDEGRTLTGLLQEMGGNGKCTVIGMGIRTSPIYAALANASLIHLLEFDNEIASNGSHATAVIFPVVMALAELNGNSGQDVLTAFSLGCETAAKLDAWATPPSGNVSPTPFSQGIALAIGAAVAGGRLLGLSVEQMERAIGLAAGQTHGPAVTFAIPARAMQYGQAAMAGIMADLLAQRGFGDNRSVYPGEPFVVDSGTDQESFFGSLANPFAIVDPGLSIKLYPCPSAGHTAIDALLQLRQQHQFQASQIDSVTVSVTPEVLNSLPYVEPKDLWQSRFSLNYITAQTLLHGQPLIEQFSDPMFQDPAVKELMNRIAAISEEVPTPLADQPATVTLRLSGGRELEQRVEHARGGPEFPLDQVELHAKFLYCARHIMTPDHIQGTIEQFRDLENVLDATGLSSILGA